MMFVSIEYGCMSLRSSGFRNLSSAGKGSTNKNSPNGKPYDFSIGSFSAIARQHAEGKSAGSRVLAAAVEMIDDKFIVVGSCWDYVNKVYDNAGYSANKRANVYYEKEDGPFVNPMLIKPGDWIMFRNLTFANIGHSVIFVEWLDFESRSALTIEYAGLNRKIPGRYREYDITKCFGLVRGKE